VVDFAVMEDVPGHRLAATIAPILLSLHEPQVHEHSDLMSNARRALFERLPITRPPHYGQQGCL
jgi:hypothetical protein